MNIPAEKDSVCFLWITVPLLPDGFKVLEAWGYKYKTMITWRKIMSLGMGFWWRGQTEHLLFGIKGKIKAFRMQEKNIIEAHPIND
jgi:N6-adenosine-specific RNA methylase IME4